MEITTTPSHNCRYCGVPGAGKYCSNCGHPLLPPRITLKSIFLDVFHLFTKLDHGFPYTLKKLVTAPGHMQWDYIHRNRYKYQKPFSMLFICGTLAAILRYLVFRSVYGSTTAGLSEAVFYREYWVLLHLALMPVYILVAYLFFIRSGYNYAEIGVVVMYLFAFLFLVSGVMTLIKLLFPGLDTVLLEIPFSLVFVPLTFIHFFRESPRWVSFLKAILILGIFFVIAQLSEDLAFKLFQ